MLGTGAVVTTVCWATGRMGLDSTLAAKLDTVVSVLTGFAFTTLGFQATVITLFFGLSDKPFFKGYMYHGHLKSFLVVYFMNMVVLVGIFVTALLGLKSIYLLKVALGLCAATLLISGLLSFAVTNVFIRSNR